MSSNHPDRLLTRDEVQSEFGLSRRFLELCAWRGDGPPIVKIGRRAVRYRHADIREWIAQRRVTPATGYPV